MLDSEQPKQTSNEKILEHAEVSRKKFYSQIFDVVSDYSFSPQPAVIPRIRTPVPLTRDRGPYADLGLRIRLGNPVPTDLCDD